MFKIVGLAALVLGSTQASASHWVRCDITAEVLSLASLGKVNEGVNFSPESRPARVVVFKVLTAASSGGHNTSCNYLVDTTDVLELTADNQIEKLKPGSVVKFDYENVGGLTPTGVAGRITWLLVD